MFRLHEAIDEETGATGILGYLTNVIEHVVLIHLIRSVLNTQPELLKNIALPVGNLCQKGIRIAEHCRQVLRTSRQKRMRNY